jgi:hypothetical protein
MRNSCIDMSHHRPLLISNLTIDTFPTLPAAANILKYQHTKTKRCETSAQNHVSQRPSPPPGGRNEKDRACRYIQFTEDS